MEINRKTLLQLRLQSLVFLVLFLAIVGLLAWLSQSYNFEADWTANKRNTLSEASAKLLERMPEPVQITAFARESELLPTRKNVQELVGRYQRRKADINLRFINPDTEPEQTRAMGISVDGELIVEYQGRMEHVTNLNEETLTNTLQRLMRSSEQHVVFITGHGERAPNGQANHDYGLFMQHLASKGIKASTLSLNDTPEIPADTAVLVIAGPRAAYLPGEVALLKTYIKKGSSLLWLHDPGALYGLDDIAKTLGVRFLPGVIVDPTTQLLGISDPSFALVTRYSDHVITRDFAFMTLYPRAAGIEVDDKSNWQATPILQSVARSWAETSALEGVIEYEDGKDTLGPLNIGLALTRELGKPEGKENSDKPAPSQRVLILGDGDFLSNAYLGNQGNQDLGYNIVNWLSHDDNFIAIPVATAPDTELVLQETTWSMLGIFFLIVLPLSLLSSGVVTWLKRRRR